MKTIETAVNELLNNLDIVENKDFIELMGQMYMALQEIEDHEATPEVFDIIIDVQQAIGEFVPADYTGKD